MPLALGLVRVGLSRALPLDETKPVFNVFSNLPGRGLDLALDPLAGMHASALSQGALDKCAFRRGGE